VNDGLTLDVDEVEGELPSSTTVSHGRSRLQALLQRLQSLGIEYAACRTAGWTCGSTRATADASCTGAGPTATSGKR
jgi:hypothetical protein